MTAEQIAKEYAKDIKFVKMFITKFNNGPNNKPSSKETSLKIITLKGLLEYEIDHDNKMLFIQSKESEKGNNAAIGFVFLEDIPRLITELQELQRIIS